MLRHYTANKGLSNIQISVPAAARKLRVLQATDGSPYEQVDSGLDPFRNWLRSRVVPFAFQEDKGWKDAKALNDAKVFCQTVGAQLWKNYIKKKEFDPASWPEERIRLCALGMEGLGLAFAFPHSVPKASLPLFWARGHVTAFGSSLDWTPLFPDADS